MEFSNVRVSGVKIAMCALIKSMRVRRRLTQEELAQRLNRSRITIQNVERGNNVTLDTYLLILQFFCEIESFNDYIQSKIDDCHEIESIY